MYSPRKKLDVPDNFKFPFTPYKIQEELMKALFNVIENKQIGIFESPTGTGKSLTLTCGALKWLEDHKKLVKDDLNERLNEICKEIKELELNGAKSNDWIEVQFGAIQKKDEFALYKKKKLQIEEYEKKIIDLKKRIIKEKKVSNSNNSKFFKKDSDISSGNIEDMKKISEKEYNDLNEDFLLVESDNDDDDDGAENDNSEENEKFRDVKIYFCSRTHSQLSQVVREIKKTPYGKYVRCVSLASRQNLCINPDVRQLGTVSLINERCLDMQKSQSKTTKLDTEGRIQKKSKKNCNTKCPYKNSILIEELRDDSLVEIHDIEDLIQAGKLIKACPYYSGREAHKDAEIIMLPYQMLLHRKTRLQTGIDLRNSVVIIDEAHNLIDTISNIYSAEINLYQLQTGLNQLQSYKKKYINHFSAKNLLKLNQLIFITKRLNKILASDTKGSRMIKTYELMGEGEFFNLDIYDILNFCEKSRLAQKVHGLAQRMVILDTSLENLNKNKDTENTTTLLRKLEEKVKNKNLKSKKCKNPVVLETNQKENQKKTIEKRTFSSVIRPLLTFLESLTECAKDGMILIKYDEDIKKAGMKFILLNPGGHFQEIINECRSIIIAGGTMQPTNELIEQLFKSCSDRVHQYFYGHVVPVESVVPLIVQKGPTSKQFLFNYTNRNNNKMLKELGMTLQNVSNVIPAGIVCFFGSYDYLDYVYTEFTKNGIISGLEKRKFIFREPRSGYSDGGKSIEKILLDYGRAIKNLERNGAIMFSVIGGKLSEGLNFSDDLGRCVIVIGMPYPNKNSPEIFEKMKYLNDNLGNGAGNEYYENLCMKSVNQCIGRVIRHVNDYACVLLLDERYSNEKIKNKLPKWISKNLKIFDNFGMVQSSIAKFFNSKRKCISNNA